jgi:phage portal protein BeeE
MAILDWINRRRGTNINQTNQSFFQYLIDKPAWLSLSSPHHYAEAAAENPIVNGCIFIIAQAAANGVKYLIDEKGNEVPWDKRNVVVQQVRKLLLNRPNPLQSASEFQAERYYQRLTFGNNYVYANNPTAQKTNILNVQALYNLPAEHVEVKQTGKLYDQIELSGIIEKYILNNYSPVKTFDVDRIIHFNDINTSGIGHSIVGTSKLKALEKPIYNTQLAFEAMNVILKSRGMQGIIKTNNKDAQGSMIPVNQKVKDDIDEAFKKGYGLGEDQKQFLITYADIEYIKTIMNSAELGIYDEFANNAMIISNGLGVPPELYKTYMKGATFENQVQAERRLYQNTVIPMVANDDQYFSERLGLRELGYELKTDWSGIQSLQEAFKEKAAAFSMNVTAAEKAYNNNIITWNQYLEIIGLEAVSDGNVFKFERDGQSKINTGANQEIEGQQSEETGATN